MKCDYLSASTKEQTSTSPGDDERHGKRIRQHEDSKPATDLPTPTASDMESEYGQTPTPSCHIDPLLRSACLLDIQSLELLHYYMCHTSITLGDPQIFRDVVPPLGFKYDCVMRMVLSITARHLYRLRPDQAGYYHRLAEDHAAAALPEVAAMLAQVNDDNSEALYYATVLISLSSFARDPSPGNILLIAAEEDEVSWWALMRGVKIVISTTGLENIRKGASAALLCGSSTWSEPKLSALSVRSLELQWKKPLAEIEELVDKVYAAEDSIHQPVLTHLKQCYRRLFTAPDEPKVDNEQIPSIIYGWLYELEDDFVSSIERRDPVSLVLLGYYAVLLQQLEHHWFMEGWSLQVINGVYAILEDSHRHFLTWPLEQVGSIWSGL
ncbi:C6 zinc finger protein [Colletotrichum fioriniae PJ7]|uniref:C6 zinc finger protein n=1 Tax=Colletotrichum fioriniae PJ7 TaxID=1445577 RepID=A0A010RY41_9PEZI|nr:C6 zinc finger protein [Colletotrichum fioriniae PJ7]